jgi:hypothetical protein
VHPLLLVEALMDRVLLGAVAVSFAAAQGGSDSVSKGIEG